MSISSILLGKFDISKTHSGSVSRGSSIRQRSFSLTFLLEPREFFIEIWILGPWICFQISLDLFHRSAFRRCALNSSRVNNVLLQDIPITRFHLLHFFFSNLIPKKSAVEDNGLLESIWLKLFHFRCLLRFTMSDGRTHQNVTEIVVHLTIHFVVSIMKRIVFRPSMFW
jgi:hypothetical protein